MLLRSIGMSSTKSLIVVSTPCNHLIRKPLIRVASAFFDYPSRDLRRNRQGRSPSGSSAAIRSSTVRNVLDQRTLCDADQFGQFDSSMKPILLASTRVLVPGIENFAG